MLFPAPTVTSETKTLPVYLFTAGENHCQEERIRPDGAEFHHLFFVTQGEMLLRTPEGDTRVRAGQAVFIPKRLPTLYRAYTDKLISGWLTFDGASVDSLLTHFGVTGTFCVDSHPLLARFELCVKAVRKGQSHEHLSALFYPLLMDFFLQKQTGPSRLQPIKTFIEERYAQDLSIADMADAGGISLSLLFRLFEQEGTTPLAYLHVCRIEQARRLLLESGDSVAHIGSVCGFHDRAYFCKVFRKTVGMSPSEFRRSFL